MPIAADATVVPINAARAEDTGDGAQEADRVSAEQPSAAAGEEDTSADAPRVAAQEQSTEAAADAEPEVTDTAAEATDAAVDTAPEAAADADAQPAAEPDGQAPPKPARVPRGERAAQRRPANPAAGGGRDRRTTAQRLGNFPRADKPAQIPSPEHHHLPGWVRRDFARARPPLSNILALLEGEEHDQFEKRINELTEGISSGKFSLAWQYPDLVDEGRTLYEKQRRDSAESARANRQLDTARRRIQDRIRDAGEALGADVSARLQRQLRSAGDAEAIAAVGSELDGVLSTARSSADKRREREIERTKARIRRSAAAAGVDEAQAPQAETWQDVLRRFAEQQAAGSRSSE